MNWPANDRYWDECLEFLRRHVTPTEAVVAPVEFEAVLDARICDEALRDLAEVDWVVVHKGRVGAMDQATLQEVAARWSPVFANEVFVVLSRRGNLTRVLSGSPHVQSFREAVAARSREHVGKADVRSDTFDWKWRVRGVLQRVARRLWAALERGRRSTKVSRTRTARVELARQQAPQPRVLCRERTTTVELAGEPSLQATVRTRPCTCLGDVTELGVRTSQFSAVMPHDHIGRQIPRKWWEWEYIAECAELCGCLDGDRSAIGLGVGREPLIFFFARSARAVVATDLYASDSAWKEARVPASDAVYEASPIPYPRDRLEVRIADMRRLGGPDASFDFAWSCSSIEHVPTLKDVLEVFRELARVLRMGGYAFLTTEYVLTEPPYLLPGVNALDDTLFQSIVGALDAFELVGPVHLTYNWAHPGNSARPRRDPPPGCLKTPRSLLPETFRSGQMANPVGISLVAPVAFVLRRRTGTIPSWDDLSLPSSIRDFTDAVTALQAGQPGTALQKLEGYVHSGQAVSLQLWLHMARYYLEAMWLSGRYARCTVLGTIDEVRSRLPASEIQDADCLDLMGYLAGECGDYAGAAHLYRLAAASPSTTCDHALRLSFDYLRVMRKLNRFDEAVQFLAAVLSDLVMHGSPLEGIEQLWSEGVRRAELTPDQLRYLKWGIDDALQRVRADFDRTLRLPVLLV